MATIIRIPSGGMPDYAVIHTHGDWDYPAYKSSYTYTTDKDYRQIVVSLAVGTSSGENRAAVELDHGDVVLNETHTRIVGGNGGGTVSAVLAVANDVPAGAKITVKGYYIRSLIIAGAE